MCNIEKTPKKQYQKKKKKKDDPVEWSGNSTGQKIN